MTPRTSSTYVTNPTLPRLLEIALDKDPAFGGTAAGKIAPKNFPRTDLMNVFLTGIAGVNRPANANVGSEMLRLNTNTPATAEAAQNTLGLAGGDPAGFPNGRRPKDDVVDISLVAFAGGLCVVNGDNDGLKLNSSLGATSACKPSSVPLGNDVAAAARWCRPVQDPAAAEVPVPVHADAGRRRRVRTEEPNMKQVKSWLVLAGAVLALAACGGGGGDGGGDPGAGPADPLDGLPTEATQSVSGWIGYLARLIKATDADDREPVAPTGPGPASLPVDDEGEPMAPGLSLWFRGSNRSVAATSGDAFRLFGPRHAGRSRRRKNAALQCQSLANPQGLRRAPWL